MAELTDPFPEPKASAVHRMDPRFKVIFLALLSVSNVNASPLGLLLLFFVQLFGFVKSGVHFGDFLKDLRYFSFFIFFVFLARALTTTGEKALQDGILSVVFPHGMQGLSAGAMAAFRLFLVVMLGFLFVSVTPPSKIRAAVAWYLKPIPFVPEKRVASMMALLVRFLPLIVQEAKETADAQKARGVENRKNPVYRLLKLAIPMLRRTFFRADELVLAMEARGYDENRSMPRLSSKKSDWLALAILLPITSLC
jgi:energy-coupling factor transporter transmembrane protein EcfT